MSSLEHWRARLGWSLSLAALGRSAAWGSSVLALLLPALPGWANTNIYIQRQGCSSGLLPIPVALLDLGDGLAEWGTGRQLVWAEQEPWEMLGRASNKKNNYSDNNSNYL